jgi:uncharacterized OB-fold protein
MSTEGPAESPNIQTRAGQEQLRQRRVRPIPRPDDVTRPYWEAAKRESLVIQQCIDCVTFRHPPSERCRNCLSTNVKWVELSGKGRVYSFIVDYRLLVPGFDRPYVVVQVVPNEVASDDVRITANLRNAETADVRIGMPVEVEFEVVSSDLTLPQFRSASQPR